MVESEKSPLDPISVIGNGCSSPLDYYYECHTAGALETILTRDDSSIAGEQRDDDDENNDPEPSVLSALRFNLTPNQQLHKPKAKRPHKVLDKTDQSVSNPSSTANGLLATAKGERASSRVVGMLEAHKRQNFENQSNSSNKKTSTKEKKQHKRFALTIPMYTSYKNVHNGNKDEVYGCSQVPPPSTNTPEGLRAIDAMKIAAAAKWRAAKRRHFASTSATGTATATRTATAPASATATATATASASSSASTPAPAPAFPSAPASQSPSPSASTAAPEQPKPKLKSVNDEDDVCEQSHPAGGTSAVTDANSVDRSRSRRQAVDPPEDLLKLPTVGAEFKSAGPLIVDTSLLNHERVREIGLSDGDGDTKTSTTSSPPLFRKFSEALRQKEDQQESHKFRLFEQRLRHQKYKTHLKERVAPLSVDLRPSGVMGEEHKEATEKWNEETKVVGDPVVPAVYLIPVEPCQ